eukprot:10319621-Heterocapsa_arctica.AAC.1
MTGFTRSCPPGPGLGQPWTDLFPVPIVMLDIPTRSMGRSHARKQFELPDNPHVRKIIWMLQKGLASTGCLGTDESEKGDIWNAQKHHFLQEGRGRIGPQPCPPL